MKPRNFEIAKPIALLAVLGFGVSVTLGFWFLTNKNPHLPQISDYICCYAPMAQTLLREHCPTCSARFRLVMTGAPAI